MKYYSYLCTRFGALGPKTERSFAPVAELVDAPDLGSGVYDVQVRVLSGALCDDLGEKWLNFIPYLCYFDRKLRFLIKKIKIFLHNSKLFPNFVTDLCEYMRDY